MTGGRSLGLFGGVERSAIRYDLATKTFTYAPNLQKERMDHSSFEMNGKIYVVAGLDDNELFLNSIERLDVSRNASQWEIFELSNLSARITPMASALNDNKFLIAGGYFDGDL